jgi:lysophospholipid hydrolase
VILTRFSRVTFNAAHKYLGLTSEVLRTEKAINDIACHPLPASFYQMGGLQLLRQRFDGAPTGSSDAETEHTSVSHSTGGSSRPTSRESTSSSKTQIPDNPSPLDRSQSSPFARSSRNLVQAGDLLIPSSHGNEYNRALPRSYSLLNTPRVPRSFDFGPGLNSGPTQSQRMHGLGIDDSFDLREEVMSCIAKSIGLLQPPLSGGDSLEPSPLLRPTDSRRTSETFSSPFGSLSLLDGGDDSSSVTAASTATSSGGYMSGLDNEVEVLYFPAGSTLAKAGELNTGELYRAILALGTC